MDSDQFDDLTRALAAPRPRRGVLTAVGGAFVAATGGLGLSALTGDEASGKGKKNKKKKKKSQCLPYQSPCPDLDLDKCCNENGVGCHFYPERGGHFCCSLANCAVDADCCFGDCVGGFCD